MRPITFRLVTLLAVACFLRASSAQCPVQWSSGGPQPELSGYGRCSTLWDPDGAGPLPQRLVIGGSRLLGGAQMAGGMLPSAQTVVTWDGSTWQPLTHGPGSPSTLGNVTALTVWNGNLVAGGSFAGAGGVLNIALWDGLAWQGIGAGFPVPVTALNVWNGNLVAVGHVLAGGPVPYIRTWNGVAWTALPTPPALQTPAAVLSFEGELIVAGSRTALPVGVLERWNGTTWASSITADSAISCLTMRPTLMVGGSDTLYAGGSFTSINGTAAARIAATSGAPSFTWSPIGGGLSSQCYALSVVNSGLTGYVLAALTGNPSTPVMQYVVSPFGSGPWTGLGSTPLQSLIRYGGSYHGACTSTDDIACRRWDGSEWVPVRGPGIVGSVHALTRSGSDMVLGGTFATISGVAMNHIARWDGTAFAPLGTGMVGSSVDALLTLDNGDIVAGGLFLTAGGAGANHIARWNGTSWSALGSGMSQQVHALCRMPNGDVIAGGRFTSAGGVACARIARWNGSVWAPLGSGMDDDVQALAVRSDGTLFAGGSFTTAGGSPCNRIARWNGTTWQPLSSGCNGTVLGLAVRPNDDVVAVGAFTLAGGLGVDGCARWLGAGWSTMGAASADSSPAYAVAALPDGDVVVGRGFDPPTSDPDTGISRWNGTTWTGLAGGLHAAQTSLSVDVRAIAQRADGDLVVGGTFSLAGFTMSHSLASLDSSCMPTAQPYGAGCSSTAGPLVLGADTLPWTGATFRTTTNGVAPGSLCLSAIGLTQLAIPLNALLAEGQPGCSLLSSLDILTLLAPGPGNTATSSFALNDDPSLLGVPFFQQTIPLEFDGTGALVAVRGSNALALVIGTL